MFERRCCCGKKIIPEDVDAAIFNDYQHDLLGPPGNFCGPVINHRLRDLEKELEKVSEERDRLFGDMTAFKNQYEASRASISTMRVEINVLKERVSTITNERNELHTMCLLLKEEAKDLPAAADSAIRDLTAALGMVEKSRDKAIEDSHLMSDLAHANAERARMGDEMLEEYRQRLAGALTVAEGSMIDVQKEPGVPEFIKNCPTITAVAKLRRELDHYTQQAHDNGKRAMLMEEERDQALADWKKAEERAEENEILVRKGAAKVEELEAETARLRGGVGGCNFHEKKYDPTCHSCTQLSVGRWVTRAEAAEEKIKKLTEQLHDADSTEASAYAQNMAAMRDQVAGTAALLKECEERYQRVEAKLGEMVDENNDLQKRLIRAKTITDNAVAAKQMAILEYEFKIKKLGLALWKIPHWEFPDGLCWCATPKEHSEFCLELKKALKEAES